MRRRTAWIFFRMSTLDLTGGARFLPAFIRRKAMDLLMPSDAAMSANDFLSFRIRRTVFCRWLRSVDTMNCGTRRS